MVPPSCGKQRNHSSDDRDRIGRHATDASLSERELKNQYDDDGSGEIDHALGGLSLSDSVLETFGGQLHCERPSDESLVVDKHKLWRSHLQVDCSLDTSRHRWNNPKNPNRAGVRPVNFHAALRVFPRCGRGLLRCEPKEHSA